MKKKFTETKVGKFLFSNVGRGLAKSIPVVGPLLGNILNNNNAAQGEVDKDEIKSDIVQVALVALIIAYLMGWISFDQVNEAKNLLNP